MIQDTHHQVDQLLLEQGEYLPLELLLQEGRLSYSDYEAWRNGKFDCLDEVVFGDPMQILQQLQQAGAYLIQRDWLAETISYLSWNSDTPQTLRFSRNITLNNDFHLRYRKPQDQPQLDMFTDAPAANLANGIRQALVDRNTAEARRQIERLYDIAPNHIQLGALEHLVEAAERLPSAVDDIASEMQTLRDTLTPLAESIMGSQCRNLLVPLWRRLSEALRGQSYQPAHPQQHISYTATQAIDWDVVQKAVEQEDAWQNEAVLLLRHALACEPLHQTAAALQSWFALCWQFPEQSDAIDCSTRQEFLQQWQTFLDLEPELPPQSFPAWYLIGKPGLTKLLPTPGDALIAPPASYCTLYQLQTRQTDMQTRGKIENDDITLRALLKQQDAELFRYFLHNSQ